MGAFGRRTTTMKSLVIGLDAPGGGVLAVVGRLLLGVGRYLSAQVAPGLVGDKQPGRNGGRAGQSRIAASDNSCQSGNSYLRALTGGYADNALNVVPFSSWLVTPTPGSNPRGCPVARSRAGY